MTELTKEPNKKPKLKKDQIEEFQIFKTMERTVIIFRVIEKKISSPSPQWIFDQLQVIWTTAISRGAVEVKNVRTEGH